jgi:hypothetical protein
MLPPTLKIDLETLALDSKTPQTGLTTWLELSKVGSHHWYRYAPLYPENRFRDTGTLFEEFH